MSRSIRIAAAACLAGAAALLPIRVAARQAAAGPDAALIAKARGIHDRVIKLDTHNDIEPNRLAGDTCNYTMRLTTQVNIPKMIEGDMDASFMIVYVGQGPLTKEGFDNAYAQAIAKFDAIHKLTEKIAPDKIGLALTPADVYRLHREGKRIAVIGVENAYPIGLDLERVQEFYKRGGRYMSLAHNGNSQMADSNTGEATYYNYNNGLSPLGRQVIKEMNRLGMMIDLSHPSKGANLEAMRLSKAPVIASHSGARAVGNVSRNMDDELLMALKKNGGVIQTVGFATYVKVNPPQPEKTAAIAVLNTEFGIAAGGGRGGNRGGGGGGRGAGAAGAAPAVQPCPIEDPNAPPAAARGGGGGRGNAALDALSPERRAEYDRKMADINAKWPVPPRANVHDFVDHIDYLVKKIGVEHVGISSDFDGGGGVDGWNSAAEAFNVTLELVRRGYTEKQIGMMWSGNLLRVWGQVQAIGKQIQASEKK